MLISGVGRKCLTVGHVIANFVRARKAYASAKPRGSGGMLPQKNLNFRLSEIVFGAVTNTFVSC